MKNEMTVAIVGGTGNLGTALAIRLAAPGVRVVIGSRDREKAKRVVESLGKFSHQGSVEGAANEEAVKEAEIVVIAVPYEGHAAMVENLKSQLTGKVILDTVVPLRKGKPFTPQAGSALQEAQEILGNEAQVVGALHNISAVDLKDTNASLGDVLVCGNSEPAKQKVMEILRRMGARSYDAGPASNAYVIEGLTGVLIQLNRKYKSKHASIKVVGINDGT